MKLFKPNWVTHDDKPIFSIDIHPAGRRFATGGQGNDSGRVVVWNLNCVLEEFVELDPNVPKMLCQMDNHLACVNSVRWSCGGRYLASGGDDKLVMVWALTGAGGSGIFGSNGKLNAETWRCISTLRGHAGDVLDLAWSPMDKWLASCSVDNTIIVWNAQKFPEMVYVLHGHTGLVKGVAWDPVGKYLASQSDDKSLRIWKTADWAEESIVTEPFEDCGGTTHVLRLSWSPDGQYVVSAHAMNGGGPTAQIVERDGWRTDKDFVGHRKAVTCVRFNSNILCRAGNGKAGGGRQRYCCTAIGSRDRSLSVWLTSLKRPLVVINELFTDSILDLSWSSDGLNLLACSWDGTVACIQFSNKEIGSPLTLQEKNALYERTYGKSFASSANLDMNFAHLLVESPEILKAREKPTVEEPKKEPAKVETPKDILTSPTATTPLPPPVTPVRPIDRQIETRTSDGKRRITPVFIPLHQSMDANDSVVPAIGAAQSDCFSSSSQNKSRILVERRDDIVTHPNVSNHATSTPTLAGAASSFVGVVPAPPSVLVPAVPTPVTPTTSQPLLQTATVVSNEINVDNRLKRRPSSNALPGPHADDVAKKRRAVSPLPLQPVASVSTTVTPLADRLPAPTLGAAGPIVRYAGKYRVQVLNNACTTPQGKLTRLQLLPGNSASSEPLWETLLGSPASCVAFAGSWFSIACADSSLHIWHVNRGPAPHRAAPPVSLPARAHRVILTTGATAYLAVLTVGAHVCVWKLPESTPPTALLPPINAQYLIPSDVTVTHFSLMDDGTPIIALSNGKGYIYCKDMQSWVISWDWRDGVWCVARGTGGVGGGVTRGPSASPAAPLAVAQASAQRSAVLTAPVNNSTAAQGNYQAGAVLSYLEWQVSTSERFASSLEYKHWLLAMAAHLTQHGPEQRLRQFLDDLMGPSHCTSKSSKWQPNILGLNKHELLDKSLEMVGKQLRWQRMYTEYTDQMDMIKQSSQNGH